MQYLVLNNNSAETLLNFAGKVILNQVSFFHACWMDGRARARAAGCRLAARVREQADGRRARARARLAAGWPRACAIMQMAGARARAMIEKLL